MAFKSKWWDRWLARGFHILLTSGVILVLFLKDTDLEKSMTQKKPIYAACYLFLVIVSTISYFITSLIDPGHVNKCANVNVENGLLQEDENESSAELNYNVEDREKETSKMMIPEGNALKLRRCGYCEIFQPLRSKHCEECGHCIRKYDHHCPWLATCIGERNHKFFWTFLLLEMILIGWTICIVWNAFKHEDKPKLWLNVNWIFLCLIIFLALALLAVVLLFGCHTYMMLTAQTTWEFMSRPRISYLKYFPDDENPFHQGYMKNVFTFLCYCKPRTWEKLIHDKIVWK